MLGYAFVALCVLFYIITGNALLMGIEFIEQGAWPFGVLTFISGACTAFIAYQCSIKAVDELK